jgi:hypothetical protein
MKIQLSGRLGNQLFEIAHGLARSDMKSNNLEFIWDIYSYPNGVSCEVLEISLIKLRRDDTYGFLFKAMDKLRSHSMMLETAVCKILRIEREHNQYRFNEPKAITGYFQDFQWAESSYLKMREILARMAAQNDVSSFSEEIPAKYQAFHYRCGDYLNHPANFGVLNTEYYLSNMERNLPVVVVTDSLEIAKEKFKHVNNIYFVDPGKSNAWHAISIISRASHVVSSNSTLSWWGAFFAMKSGATAVLPFPFFANRNQVNLYHPNFKQAPALFD